MASLLRRGLRCFYCGSRSSRKGTPGLQQWQCEACEAVNHLDENGEIADPPAVTDTPNIRYARTIERPVSPSFQQSDGSLFCNTCVKNQHILTQALASYLPSPTDPQYPDYEKQYPEYRRGLEERYPQVCDNCKPRVQQRLQATGYAAKTDHLRRMMDKSRAVKGSQYRWSWRHVVAHAGGSGWLLALIGQILWNALGASANFEGDLRDYTFPILLQNYLQQSFGPEWKIPKISDLTGSLASGSLVLGMLSIWWNPRLSNKISGQVGRLIGLSEFYKLQGILNLTRLLAWYSIGKDQGFHLDSSATKAVHAIMLVFNLIVSLISYRTVRIDSTAKVIFQDSSQSLHSRQAVENHAPPVKLSSTPALAAHSSFNHHDSSVTSQFPIHRLASPSSPTYTSYQPPTPPPEVDVDEMDWTPAKSTFEPSRPAKVSKLIPPAAEPSPFHGRLPLPPMSKARYLRNPPSQATFRKTSAVQQQRFLGSLMSSVSAEIYNSDETETEAEDRDDLDMKRLTPTVNRIKMHRPSFFAQSELEADTGLESLINGVFSLADDPPEIRAEREKQIHEQQRLQEDRDLRNSVAVRERSPWERIASIVLLSLACLSWSYAGAGTIGAQVLRYFALGTTAVIIGQALFDAINIHQALWKASDILVLGVELGITIFLGRAVKSSGTGGDEAADEYGSGPILFLGALWMQELMSFIRKCRASVSSVASSIGDPSPPASNNSELDANSPPSQHPSAPASRNTVAGASPRRTGSPAASADPRPSRTKARRVEPSENLPGLSLGPKKKASNASTAPRNPGWSSNQGVVTRSMRSSNGTPAWGRGTL
ncbi:hypothetical protein MMC26_006341 [Xylographa opegraphella]|nr:hypothetical protein [Xylographa opegraphella]